MQSFNRIRPETLALLSVRADLSQETETFGATLIKNGALRIPGILAQTIIELPNECEYCLTSLSEEDLRSQSLNIRIRRLYDWREEVIPREELLKAIQESQVFDQLTLRSKA